MPIESVVGTAAAIVVGSLIRALWERRRSQRPPRERGDTWATAAGYQIAKQTHRLAALD